MPLPPYLTSFASSRAHHALLVKLEAAQGPGETDAIVREQVEQCRAVLASSPSSGKVADTLIILLHCAMLAHEAVDGRAALVPAMQVAEGGRRMRERRMGYTYLAENLPEGHELQLLLVNTIRKDLASDSDAHVLAGLHAVAHMPGADLAPAVVPLLKERRLVEHGLPVIRQRTIQALTALVQSGAASWPMSLRELARRLRHEDDASVRAVLFRAFGLALDTGVRETDAARRRRQLDSVFAAAKAVADGSTAAVAAAAVALVAILNSLTSGDELREHVLQQTDAVLAEVVEHAVDGMGNARLLESTKLAAALLERNPTPSDAINQLLKPLRTLLAPRPLDKPSSRAPPSEIVGPNTRILVLRCYSLLPPAVWQAGLREYHMEALLRGVDSVDDSLRRATLRLLAKADGNLPTLTLQGHLEALRAGRGVPTPSSPSSPRASPRKQRTGDAAAERTEAATRALEAVQIGAEGLDDVTRGTRLAEGVRAIAAALRTGGEDGVWVKGVQAVLGDLTAGSAELRDAFTSATAEELVHSSDPSAAVLLTTLASEYPATGSDAVISSLVAALPDLPGAVQELVLLAFIPLLATSPATQSRVADVLRTLIDSSKTSKHISRRATQVLLILQHNLAPEVVKRAKSRSLGDVLDALLAVYDETTAPDPEPEPRSPGPSLSASLRGNSALRYEAYDDKGKGKGRANGTPAAALRSPRAMGRSMLVHKEEEDEVSEEIQLDSLTLSGRATPTAERRGRQ